MHLNKLNFVGPVLFLKFSLLMAIIVSLTVAKPMAMAAHKGSQKICSLVMNVEECAKHC